MKAKGVDLSLLGPLEGMDIGCEPGDIETRLPLIKQFSGLRWSVSAGPWCLGRGKSVSQLISQLKEDCGKLRPDFIGETGIDRHYNYGEKGEMEELFIACIELANELNLPITVHNREADKTVLEILRTHRADRRGIIHCFSGDRESARQFLDLGYAISFAGNVTYKSNEALREAVSYVPDSSILLETDSPYLSPVPVRGRVNTPLNISYTYEFAAQLRGTSAQELNEKVKQNYFSIL